MKRFITMAIEVFNEITPDIHPTAFVHDQACVIGDVVIGEDSSIWPMTVARGDVNKIRIGARSNIQDGSILHVTHAGPHTGDGLPLLIGDDVTVGHGVILHACTVGNRCLIGMGAVILDGAILEDDCFIAAGAVVSPGKRVTSGTLWLGNPAREKRKLSEEEIERLKYSADHYVKIKNQYMK